MTGPGRLRVGAAALALCLMSAQPMPAADQQDAPGGPKLVVLLVVDQLRADYLERYAAGFTGGLKRLMADGAWFDRAAYPYLNTITCAGHSTIGTGTFPYRHGMMLNAWYDRAARKTVECTDDPRTTEISYGPFKGMGDSAHYMKAPTLAAQLRDRVHGRTVTMSIKARSAIGMAGKKADVVLWFDERGAWTTSSAYAKRPVPWVQQHIIEHPVLSDLGRRWDKMMPLSAYQFTDERPGEKPPTGWTSSFPHLLGTPGAKTNASFFSHWLRSPYADEYLGSLAAAAVDTMHLGSSRAIDFLGISFSALDSVGHNFGPESHEVQDILARLDLTIGRLLDHLDKTVGRGGYVLALSADHGVAGIPEQVPGAGRLTSAHIGAAVDAALQPLFGARRIPAKGKFEYMEHNAYTEIYLSRGVAKRVRRTPEAITALKTSIGAVPGIARVFLATEISTPAARRDADPMTRAAALNYVPGRSGDLIIVPRENWIMSTSATTHGTLHPYDQRVPVIVFGPGVRAGRYSAPATPADIAPTLAALMGVPIGPTDGRVLAEAMASSPSTR